MEGEGLDVGEQGWFESGIKLLVQKIMLVVPKDKIEKVLQC